MTVVSSTGFDRIATQYEQLWSGTRAGQLQREAVWRHAAYLVKAGNQVLDLGCGTGDDALMLAARGARVTGIDASSGMVQAARERGVDAHCLAIENMAEVPGTFDVIWSNFGALNCVEHLPQLREPLAKRLNDGGLLIVCLMSRVCLWETVWFGLHGQFRKAARRWKGEASSSLAQRVFYPTAGAACRAFAPDFTLVASHGIGIAVPPSGVCGISDSVLDRLGTADRALASLPLLRSIGDHRLLVLRKETDR